MHDALLRSQINELERALFTALRFAKESREMQSCLSTLSIKINDLLAAVNEDENNLAAFSNESKIKGLLNTVVSLKRELLLLQASLHKNLSPLNDFSLLLERFRDSRTYVFKDTAHATAFVEKLLYYWNEKSAILMPRIEGLIEKEVIADLCRCKTERGYEIDAENVSIVVTKLFAAGISDIVLDCGECRITWLSRTMMRASATPERIKELDAIALTQNAMLK